MSSIVVSVVQTLEFFGRLLGDQRVGFEKINFKYNPKSRFYAREREIYFYELLTIFKRL